MDIKTIINTNTKVTTTLNKTLILDRKILLQLLNAAGAEIPEDTEIWIRGIPYTRDWTLDGGGEEDIHLKLSWKVDNVEVPNQKSWLREVPLTPAERKGLTAPKGTNLDNVI